MAVYGFTIFAGAFLLFQVQPVLGKYILPWFGGTPSVWTTCMLFFQVVLLLGYAYAHLVSTRLKPKWQVITHLTLTIAAFWFLPAVPSDTWKPKGSEDPTWRIIGLLCATIGLPYLVLSATSPLLQHWFARANDAKAPYRLYALSNAGSLLALATYPTLFETHLVRKAQASLWAWGLVLFGAGLGCCATSFWKCPPESDDGERSREALEPGEVARAEACEGPIWSRMLLWIVFPACASALLLATTNKMCQEVAVVPFLWVAPLGLYLLSFIICFDSPRWYRRFPFGLGLLAVMGAICWALFHSYDISVRAQMVIYGCACFFCCMICHGEVYRLKPNARKLTAFYLMIALGGALGGIFVGIISPLIFHDYFELQWSLAICVLLFQLVIASDWHRNLLKTWSWRPALLPSWGALACCGLGVAWLGMVAFFWVQDHKQDSITTCKTRNFYGVLTVLERTDNGSGMRFSQLMHGRTNHGLQFEDSERANWPTMYYSERTGIGRAMQQIPAGARRIGLVGLGTGTLAAYGKAGDSFRFYEINPSVLHLAQSQFSYLTNCRAEVQVVLGDARLSLEKEPPQGFDILALDAFSSDAIPVHLLTEEAFQLYRRHVKSSGIIAVHISNTSLDLEPVIANVATRLGYETTLIDYRPPAEKWWVCRSKWVLLAKGEIAQRLGRCCRDARASRMDLAHVPLWTDDFSSLFQILWRPSAWKIEPCTAELELQSALASAESGNVAGAMQHYQAALESEPDLPIALNNLAWILAANSDASLRNGTEALKYARRACELTNFRTTVLVGTLAAAYAEAGQFPEAVATAEMACHLASGLGDTALLHRNEQLLELYRLGKPARD
jgi:tetratricopeptide (TPR) repeat protein